MCIRDSYVGRLAPEKNIELLIDAMALTQARHPDRAMVLDIVGDGPSREALTERAARQSTVTIRFLGAQDRQCALPRIYAEADAFVYASATETLGLVVLEAMAAGLPVIATPAGGIAEHLRDDINGLAYPCLLYTSFTLFLVLLFIPICSSKRSKRSLAATL